KSQPKQRGLLHKGVFRSLVCLQEFERGLGVFSFRVQRLTLGDVLVDCRASRAGLRTGGSGCISLCGGAEKLGWQYGEGGGHLSRGGVGWTRGCARRGGAQIGGRRRHGSIPLRLLSA